MTVLYCQHCGLSQLVTPRGLVLRTVTPCTACGGLHFNTLHPRRRDPRWVWPGYSDHDVSLLEDMGIAREDARYDVRAAPGSGGEWWIVVDQHAVTMDARVVQSFGPVLRDPEAQARAYATTLNREALGV